MPNAKNVIVPIVGHQLGLYRKSSSIIEQHEALDRLALPGQNLLGDTLRLPPVSHGQGFHPVTWCIQSGCG